MSRLAQAGDRPTRVLFSAHGLPERVIKSGDPYQKQVEQTAAAAASPELWPERALPLLARLLAFARRRFFGPRLAFVKFHPTALTDIQQYLDEAGRLAENMLRQEPHVRQKGETGD